MINYTQGGGGSPSTAAADSATAVGQSSCWTANGSCHNNSLSCHSAAASQISPTHRKNKPHEEGGRGHLRRGRRREIERGCYRDKEYPVMTTTKTNNLISRSLMTGEQNILSDPSKLRNVLTFVNVMMSYSFISDHCNTERY